jgi:ATP-dependent exoDNAse (exonuclease V) alpha subunit
MQLPPVCYCSKQDAEEACERCHISQNQWWVKAEVHKLSVSERHTSDPVYSQFLKEIREDKPSAATVDDVLKDCYIEPEDVLSHVCDNSTTILCSHTSQVQDYNARIFDKLFPDTTTHVHTPVTHNTYGFEDTKSWLDQKHFHYLERVAIGAKVMILKNMDSNGACNGSIGIVQGFNKVHGVLRSIRVRLMDSDHEVNVYRSNVKTLHRHCRQFTKRTFPLILAYAMTGHKSQGATLRGKTIVHIKNAFTPGLAYVMLSRVVSRANMKVVRPLAAADIIPMTLGSK